MYRFQRPPGALPSSLLGLEAMTGSLDDFGVEDYLNGNIIPILIYCAFLFLNEQAITTKVVVPFEFASYFKHDVLQYSHLDLDACYPLLLQF